MPHATKLTDTELFTSKVQGASGSREVWTGCLTCEVHHKRKEKFTCR